MRSLIDFEVPKRGEVTLCEIDGRVISSCYDFPNINIFTTAVSEVMFHLNLESRLYYFVIVRV